jgi:hypothetical protein
MDAKMSSTHTLRFNIPNGHPPLGCKFHYIKLLATHLKALIDEQQKI